jgi:hypothetical protein
MSIWITGDCHSDVSRFSTDSFPEQKEMTKDDVILIAGDFGLVWNCKGEDNIEKWWLDWLEEKPFTTCFVDGNHENHDRLDEYPVEEWHGGKISRIRPSVIHLKRGQVFDIEGKKFFTFGGASSHDIKDGILDVVDDAALIKKWRNDYTKLFRINKVSWWDRELPSEEEMKEGMKNLEKHDWKVDYILTHSPSASVIALLGQGLYEQDVLTKYLEEIRCKTEYKKWMAGHFHVNRAVNDKDILLYEQIVRIV